MISRMIILALLWWCRQLPAATDDPRPHLLILGGTQCLNHDFGLGWPALLRQVRPEWRITVQAESGWLALDAAKACPTILSRIDPCDAVLVLFGTDELRSRHRSTLPRFRRALEQIIQQVHEHQATAKALVVLMTPVPIVDAWLDRWMGSEFQLPGQTGAESLSLQLAQTIRDLATAQNLPVLDLHNWVRTRNGQGNHPNRVVNGSGCIIELDGERKITTFVAQSLSEQNRIRPRNQAAYDQWLSIRKDLRVLCDMLASTGSGLVDHDPPLITRKLEDQTEVDIPLSALNQPALDLLITADQAQAAVVQLMGNDQRAGIGTTLIVRNRQAVKKELAVGPMAWQVLSEDEPDRIVSPWATSHNAGGLRLRPMVSNVPGHRRWLLVRIPLQDLLDRKDLTEARLLIHHGLIDQELPAPTGNVLVHLVSGLDLDWSPGLATWRSSGHAPWTGSTPDPNRRIQTLRGFLGQDFSSEAKLIARSLLQRDGGNATLP